MTTDSFREAYGTLQRNAEKLRTQREPDLDSLLDVVTQSVAAYKVCKSRIDAVEQALEQALSGAGLTEGEDGNPRAAARSPAPRPTTQAVRTDSTDFDDDIPF